MLPPEVLESFVARRNTANDTALMIEFQDWVRSSLVKPRNKMSMDPARPDQPRPEPRPESRPDSRGEIRPS